jgi:DNA gyrase subunit A
VIINQLYKYTELQTSYGINNVALVKGRPSILNLKELISEFVEFRHEVVVRRTQVRITRSRKESPHSYKAT